MSGVEDCPRDAASCTSQAQEIADHHWAELIGKAIGWFRIFAELCGPPGQRLLGTI